MRDSTTAAGRNQRKLILVISTALLATGWALAETPIDQLARQAQSASGIDFSNPSAPGSPQVKGGGGGGKKKSANPPPAPPADPTPPPPPPPPPPTPTPPADPPATAPVDNTPIAPDTVYPFEVDLNDGRIVMCELQDDGDYYNLIKKGGVIHVNKNNVKLVIPMGPGSTTMPATQPDPES